MLPSENYQPEMFALEEMTPYEMVHKMHSKFGISYSGPPRHLEPEEKNFRGVCLKEEVAEYEEAETKEDELDALIENVFDIEALKGQAAPQYPRSVPEDYAGPWRLYQRFRIPSRKAERIPGRSVRLKRINEAAAQDLPFFQMASKSNGGRFRLYWSTQPYADNELHTHEPYPDSWGLSTTTNLVPIPDIQ
jgi:hypothetical protein